MANDDERSVATARLLIESLTEVTADMVEGLDAEVEFAICDGNSYRFIDNIDLDCYTKVSKDGVTEKRFLILRGHLHRPEDGRTAKGVAAEIEDDLRRLTEPEEG